MKVKTLQYDYISYCLITLRKLWIAYIFLKCCILHFLLQKSGSQRINKCMSNNLVFFFLEIRKRVWKRKSWYGGTSIFDRRTFAENGRALRPKAKDNAGGPDICLQGQHVVYSLKDLSKKFFLCPRQNGGSCILIDLLSYSI